MTTQTESQFFYTLYPPLTFKSGLFFCEPPLPSCRVGTAMQRGGQS